MTRNSKIMLLISLLALTGGFILLKQALLIRSGLAYILLAAGCLLFGKSTGELWEHQAFSKDEQARKQKEIEEKDERNVQIQNLSKAKAYDLMSFAFGALMLAFALMDENFRVIISLVAVYLLIHLYSIFWHFRLDKKM